MKSKTKYAVHTHIGVFWDGGVRLLAVYNWFILARIHCWWHVRVQNAMRVGTVRRVKADAELSDYCGNTATWNEEMISACPTK